MRRHGRQWKVLELTGRVGNVALWSAIVLDPAGRVGVVLFISLSSSLLRYGAGLRFGAVLIVLIPSVSRMFRNILRQNTPYYSANVALFVLSHCI
jgi:hypothetical protein